MIIKKEKNIALIAHDGKTPDKGRINSDVKH